MFSFVQQYISQSQNFLFFPILHFIFIILMFLLYVLNIICAPKCYTVYHYTTQKSKHSPISVTRVLFTHCVNLGATDNRNQTKAHKPNPKTWKSCRGVNIKKQLLHTEADKTFWCHACIWCTSMTCREQTGRKLFSQKWWRSLYEKSVSYTIWKSFIYLIYSWYCI